MTNSYKSSLNFDDFLGNVVKNRLKKLLCLLFGQFLATFYSSIWSHWPELTLLHNKTNVSNDKPGETKTSMEEERVLGAEQV